MRKCLVGAVLLALGLFPLSGAARDNARNHAIYHRDTGSPSGALGVLRNLAIRRGADRMIIVFDTITFDPPPGRTEYSVHHDFRSDLPGWIDAIAAFRPPENTTLHVATTTSAKPHDTTKPDWRKEFEEELATAWWARDDFDSFESAPKWLSRLLSRVRRHSLRTN